MAADLRPLGAQPARPDRHVERRPAAAGVGVDNGGGPAGDDAARARRHDVPRAAVRLRRGPRRARRLARLGVPARAGRPRGQPRLRQPQRRPLRRQAVHRHPRRPPRRPRRPHRRGRVGRRGRRLDHRPALLGRPHDHQGARGRRHVRLLSPEHALLGVGPRRRDRGRGVAHLHHSRPRRVRLRELGRRARRGPAGRLGVELAELRPRAEPDLHRRRGADSVGVGAAGHRRRRRPLHQLDPRARRRHRRDRLVLPAHPQRRVGPRPSLRAARRRDRGLARRRRVEQRLDRAGAAAEDRDRHPRQDRHRVGARRRHRGLPLGPAHQRGRTSSRTSTPRAAASS